MPLPIEFCDSPRRFDQRPHENATMCSPPLRRTSLDASSPSLSLAPTTGLGSAVPTIVVEDESKWKDRLPDQDRAAAEAGIGFEVPAFPEGLTWIGAPSEVSMEKLRGKVIVLQTWTCGTSLGRGIPKKLGRSLGDLAQRDDVEVILVHTPQDEEKSARFCARAKPAFPVAVDTSGAFCDQLGAFKLPVNVIVDRSGTVRYAGLTDRGAASAVTHLLTLPFDPAVKPQPRPVPDASTATPRGTYPPMTRSAGAASDLRGRTAPPFVVDRWISPEPDARGKIAIIDFWATWCGPCIKAIPHMNQLAEQFRGKVECVGISDESKSAFETGIEKKNLKGSDFRYALALQVEDIVSNLERHAQMLSEDPEGGGCFFSTTGHPRAQLTAGTDQHRRLAANRREVGL